MIKRAADGSGIAPGLENRETWGTRESFCDN
jgi:hypothetical protein